MSEENLKHPKGLYVLFVTEMWERFSYYGMRAIFTLFLTKALLFDKALGSQIYGSYTGLVYLTPLVGGYVADKYWGNRKSIIIGGILMAVGQFLMFASGMFYTQVSTASLIMYSGLAFLIFGNGFFKPNISTMVGQLYPKGDKRIDSAFTIFYMGINLGAFMSPLICGTLGDTGNPADFKWGFFAAGIGMLIGLILFVWLKDHYIVTPTGEAIGGKPKKLVNTINIDTVEELKSDFSKGQIILWSAIALVLFLIFLFIAKFDIIASFIFALTIAAPGLIVSDRSLTKVERDGIWVIYIVAFFVIFFWSAFEQAGASLTYFAEEQTDRVVETVISKGVASFLLIIVTGILGYLFYKVLSKMKNEQRGIKELFEILLGVCTLFCIYGIIIIPSEGLYIKDIPASYFQSINAVAIVVFAPIFAMIWVFLGKRNMEPSSPYKQSIGLFLLAIGYAVIAMGVKDAVPGVKVSMLWLFNLYVIHTFGELFLSPIGLSMVNKLAPVKFASLLMGVWFLSSATANKFAGMLSALYPENGMVTNFLGYKISDLYDFFMLFVMFAGVAAVILFFLSRKLLKMMHGAT
jgi:POT family proton-dependent oligopeptide transporter